MTAELRVIATPIGNLGDLTPRAQQALATADLVLCEDTRHSGALLNHLGIKKPLWSLHAHNETGRIDSILHALAEGQVIALVSDAGTPCLSDPGAELVAAVRHAGYAVTSLPGPFAAAVALAASGMTPVPFAFWGFLAKKSGERRSQLQARLLPGPDGPMSHAFYVPGRDLDDVLADLVAVAPAAKVCVARELTKIHEGFWLGTAAEVAGRLGPEQLRGEAVVLVEISAKPAGHDKWSEAQLTEKIIESREAGHRAKHAVADLAAASGWTRSDVYALWVANTPD